MTMHSQTILVGPSGLRRRDDAKKYFREVEAALPGLRDEFRLTVDALIVLLRYREVDRSRLLATAMAFAWWMALDATGDAEFADSCFAADSKAKKIFVDNLEISPGPGAFADMRGESVAAAIFAALNEKPEGFKDYVQACVYDKDAEVMAFFELFRHLPGKFRTPFVLRARDMYVAKLRGRIEGAQAVLEGGS